MPVRKYIFLLIFLSVFFNDAIGQNTTFRLSDMEQRMEPDTLVAAPMIELSEILDEVKALRRDVSEMDLPISGEVSAGFERLNDRLGAVEERLIMLESRVGRLFNEVGGVGSNFNIAIGLMLGIGFLTVLVVFLLRKQHIDPVRNKVQMLELELAKIDSERNEKIQKLLLDVGKDDPHIAQLLRKHGLD